MPASIVITVIGPDRPGLVESLSRLIAEHGGNWTSSRMARLAGQFAGILHVVLADTDAAGGLEAAIQELAKSGLRLAVAREGIEDPDPASAPPLLTLDLVGQDRPGIVRGIARALAARGVNVEELSTDCESAPWSGETLFKAQAKLRPPENLDLDALQADLEAIAQDLMVDLSLVQPA